MESQRAVATLLLFDILLFDLLDSRQIGLSTMPMRDS